MNTKPPLRRLELFFPGALLIFQHPACIILRERSPQLDTAWPPTLGNVSLKQANWPFNTTANSTNLNLRTVPFDLLH